MRFTEKDVVRHPLVQSIVRAYEEHESRARPPSSQALAPGEDPAAE